MGPARGELPTDAEIREVADVPQADWTSLFAGETDPFEIEPLGLAWRAKDTHFVLYAQRRAASHVSVLLHHVVRVGGESVPVTGVAGVLTQPSGAAPAPLPAMVLALGERPWPAGPVDLDSRPW